VLPKEMEVYIVKKVLVIGIISLFLGIDPDDLHAHLKKFGSILEYPHKDKIFPDETVVYQECDIFAPAA
jgi:glutamate dehydrogenase/leucine dehydrogenase